MCHISTKMEQPFYHDDSFLSAYGTPDAVALRDYKLLKQSMSASFVEPYRNFKSDFYPAGSADAGSLKLAAPELERLIAQSGGGVITSPTPGQYHLYGRSITEEQEGFADGFVKALDELHKMNQVAPPNVSIGGVGVPPSVQTDAPVYATLNSCSPNTSVQQPASPVPFPSATISYLPHHPQFHHQHQQQPHHHQHQPYPFQHALHAPRLSALKEEPQIVPDVHGACADGSPPTSPVDLEEQERKKAERKRLRNRMAATKCRRRKLERISRLEDKVKVLKTDNAGLSNTASRLREQVEHLKQKVMTHVSSGCQLMLTPKIKSY
ncbi:junB proto-oncogene, AP-1 transcription factor subunit a isoform X1 [Tachysurus fulvidraco]|uniref:junB proto-oncogene, AP-1 transcription factor subunit a isoform X1 n=2 Tax=Tachysurus fulvidraco TaxID=1234273 RepID=UPI000F50D77D|nr:junB proto-oncogene, AP-1 transcription factor subunit a isoform X1 [Tachysurus fulvidraco]